jgi:hypothetical protein
MSRTLPGWIHRCGRLWRNVNDRQALARCRPRHPPARQGITKPVERAWPCRCPSPAIACVSTKGPMTISMPSVVAFSICKAGRPNGVVLRRNSLQLTKHAEPSDAPPCRNPEFDLHRSHQCVGRPKNLGGGARSTLSGRRPEPGVILQGPSSPDAAGRGLVTNGRWSINMSFAPAPSGGLNPEEPRRDPI